MSKNSLMIVIVIIIIILGGIVVMASNKKKATDSGTAPIVTSTNVTVNPSTTATPTSE